MKFAITGASGFLGLQLVRRLAQSGHDIRAFGRTASPADPLTGGIETRCYESFRETVADCDRVLHLAAINSDAEASEQEFFDVNAGLTRQLAQQSAQAGVRTFINFSSFHALKGGPDTKYARSKRAGVDALAEVGGIFKVNLYLPAVYGDGYAGKLSILNTVPGFLQPWVLKAMSALAPTVHVDRIAELVTSNLDGFAGNEPVFLADSQDQNSIYRFLRKLIDIGFAVSVLCLLWWLLLLVWGLVKAGSKGPGILAQERVGRNGTSFTCYKFRTMDKDTRQAGTHEISESAVTPIGAFLRRTKIDELPQVFNILKGDLSLVGPRPCLPIQKELVKERQQRGVLDILPGITGLAQIQGIDMSDPERLARKDAEYIARRGLLLDLKIILATFTGKGQGDRTAK